MADLGPAGVVGRGDQSGNSPARARLAAAMTAQNIIDHLAKRASEGVARVRASNVAAAMSIAPATVQHYGRKGLTHHKWSIIYDRGWFALSQREDWEPTPEPVAPEWFEIPQAMPSTEAHEYHFDVGQRRALVSNFITDCLAGHIALAPWQRGEVWTECQQIDLLDSMIRGLSIGSLTLWTAGTKHAIGRSLPGCEVFHASSWRNHLIVDGQQRATTLIRASLGHLDHWRWNGREWSTGKGFLTPSRAVTSAVQDTAGSMDWSRLVLSDDVDELLGRRMFDDGEKIQRTDLDLMVLGGSAAEMIKTYRRLATHGSPHSPEDLAVMERWAKESLT